MNSIGKCNKWKNTRWSRTVITMRIFNIRSMCVEVTTGRNFLERYHRPSLEHLAPIVWSKVRFSPSPPKTTKTRRRLFPAAAAANRNVRRLPTNKTTAAAAVPRHPRIERSSCHRIELWTTSIPPWCAINRLTPPVQHWRVCICIGNRPHLRWHLHRNWVHLVHIQSPVYRRQKRLPVTHLIRMKIVQQRRSTLIRLRLAPVPQRRPTTRSGQQPILPSILLRNH